MEEVGKIIKNKGKRARVMITRHSACSKCDKQCPMSDQDSHEKDQVIIDVDNDIGAIKGERVKLEMKERNLVFVALIVYVMPIINMIIGYFLGDWYATKSNIITGEIAGILGSFLFLTLSFIVIKLVDVNLKNDTNFKPVMTEVIDNRHSVW
jgi:sigma-E factor negative regulatory protein RseC